MFIDEWLSIDDPRGMMMTVEEDEMNYDEEPDNDKFMDKNYGKYILQAKSLKFDIKEITYDVLRWFFFHNFLNTKIVSRAKHPALSHRLSSRLNALIDEDVPVMIFPGKFARMFNYKDKIILSNRTARILNMNELLSCLLYEYGLMKNTKSEEDIFYSMGTSPIESAVLVLSKKSNLLGPDESICTLAIRYIMSKSVGISAVDSALSYVNKEGFTKYLKKAILKIVEVPELNRLFETDTHFSTRDLLKIQKKINKVLDRSNLGKLLTSSHNGKRLYSMSKSVSQKLGIEQLVNSINQDESDERVEE